MLDFDKIERTVLPHLVNAASEAFVVVDSTFRIAYANKGVEAIFGWSVDELLGQNLNVLLPKQIREQHPAYMREFARYGAASRTMAERVEVQGLRRSGCVFPAEVSIVAETLEGVPYFAAIVRDVTERRMKQYALERSETRLKNAQKIAGMGNWELDIETWDLTWSREASVIFGVSPKTRSGSFSGFLRTVHPDDRDAVRGAIRAATEKGWEYSLDHRVVLPNGETRYVHGQAILVKGHGDRADFLEGIVQDITERQRNAEALQQAVYAAVEANKAKDRFLATMSHELRTPLNPIIGLAEVMQGEMMGPIGSDVYKGYAGDIAKSATHLLVLIEGILDVSHFALEGIELREEEFGIEGLLNEAIKATDLDRLKGMGRVTLRDDTRICSLFADRRRCYQMLTNILRNSFKFSRPGTPITVTLSHDGSGFAIVVEDRGAGIPASALPTIADPFVKLADPGQAKSSSGVGLGLYIVKQLMEAHGGEMEIESTVNVGTKVKLIFPTWRARHDAMRGAGA
ncbi:PAS domain S-box protein [Rhodospirillaceae bacterium KN72]|uniref:histidine kinase n=1 Tax=Pacificispira spongiicola TaxID=2729598 RepID=A0A7Y0E2C0_9PROT|nr:PAS domain-containing sensor histidine kinase [Pacificispira spongiicola]NMM45873.1 PAS domain S-box protein [Pacificispira spongiicola]